MDGFERRKEKNKQKILDATAILLKEQSFKEINIDDVARKAGVSKVTIYNLFGSKDNLIYIYIENFTNKVIEQLRELMQTDASYMEKLEAIVQFAARMSQSSPGLNRDEIRNDPKLKQLVNNVLEWERKLVFEYIKEGKKQGYLNPDLSDEAIRTYIEIIGQGMRSSPELHDKILRSSKLFHDLMLMLLYGFGKINQ